MKATLLLKKDHQGIRDFFELFDQTEDVAECFAIFSRIRDELDIHATIEEEILYPALERLPDLVDLVADARRDHDDLRRQFREVKAAGRDAIDFEDRVMILRDDLERHIETEEGELFRIAREQLADDAIEALGIRLQERKTQLLRERHLEPV